MSKAFKIGAHGVPNLGDEDAAPSTDNPTRLDRAPQAGKLYSFAEDDDRLNPTQLMQSLRDGGPQPVKERTIIVAEQRAKSKPPVEHTKLMPTAPSLLGTMLTETVQETGMRNKGASEALDATMLAPPPRPAAGSGPHQARAPYASAPMMAPPAAYAQNDPAAMVSAESVAQIYAQPDPNAEDLQAYVGGGWKMPLLIVLAIVAALSLAGGIGLFVYL